MSFASRFFQLQPTPLLYCNVDLADFGWRKRWRLPQKRIYEMGNVWKCAKGIGICIIDGFFQVKWKVWHQWTGTDKLGGMMHHGPTSCMQVLRCSPPSASWASCKLSHMIMQFMEVSSEIHLCKPSSPKSSITTTPTVVSSKNLMAS